MRKNRFPIHLFTIFLVVAINLFWVMPAYADEDGPSIEPIASEEVVDVIEQVEAEQEPLDEVQDKSSLLDSPTSDTEPGTEDSSLEDVLAQVPANTEIIVLDEEGEAIPLVTEEAVEAIIIGDPIWCPATVTKPTPNMNGCTASYSTFAALLTDPIMTAVGPNGVGPTKDGTIWIASNYNNADNSTITLNGSTLTAMNDFKLTIKGGWCDGTDITCVGLIDITKPSTFDVGIHIINWNNDVTMSNIIISGATGDGINITTTGNINLTNVQSNNNTGRGAYLDNTNGLNPLKNVTVTNSKFINNSGAAGLRVETLGLVTIKDITANDNSGYGLYVDTDLKTVTVNGTANTFNNNNSDGLFITTAGVITLTNITANDNGNTGAQLLNNAGSPTTNKNGITLSGFNIFSDNNSDGLRIETFGAVKINNVFANSNGNIGVSIDNDEAPTPLPAPQSVTFTGTNQFKFNTSMGLYISSMGQITLNNITANSNGAVGASINNDDSTFAAGVTMTGTNSFSNNFYTGLIVNTFGTVIISNITADDNGVTSGYGARIDNDGLINFKGVTLSGTNSFNDNYEDGLYIVSSGVITLANITANDNGGPGINANNQASGPSNPKGATLTGKNFFNNNSGNGLMIYSYGVITVNNITANGNSSNGADLQNGSSDTPQKVTVAGTNFFNNNSFNGLQVISKGIISTSTVTANNNVSFGVNLANTTGPSTSGITMSGTNIVNGNTAGNISIQAAGNVSLSNVTANNSTGGTGANINNTYSGEAKTVILSGTNTFSGNAGTGLQIDSNGAITVSNLTANLNVGGSGANLSNGTSPVKAGITINGFGKFNNNGGIGANIISLGNVTTTTLTANSNGSYGVEIETASGGGIGNVTLNGTNTFTNNAQHNLDINAFGIVKLNSINSTGSAGGRGAEIINTAGGTAILKPVTLTGTNIFSDNSGTGLNISSYGVVTLNSVSANGNNQEGAVINNSIADTSPGVTLTGNNSFSDNFLDGLEITTKGLIKTNSIIANNNTNGNGAQLFNNNGTAPNGVTMTGTNQFIGNGAEGLDVRTHGVITASNITASNSANSGASFVNTYLGNTNIKPVTLTGTNVFNGNNNNGLSILTYGAITLSNITANDNGNVSGRGAILNNATGDPTKPVNVTLSGTNTFNNNEDEGLNITTRGSILVNNLTANDSDTETGVFLDNSTAPNNTFSITVTGFGKYNNNQASGLLATSMGAVTLSNTTASNNGLYGVYLDNTYAGPANPKPVTFNGTNTFNNNVNAGATITSNGVVTMNNISADSNGFGVSINNSSATIFPAKVTITGTNKFTNNTQNGLYILTDGLITLNNITATGNTFSGVDLSNTGGTAGVTFIGSHIFNTNGDNGLTVSSNGAISLSNFYAEQNGQSGITFVTVGNVTLSCGYVIDNAQYGWEIFNASLATVKGVVSVSNTMGEFNTSGVGTLSFFRACP